ncbi:MAG: divergent polysaccharide deacetylase family protein [Rhodospirillales bacterium]|nr:divergent polysaccharide deacetylase family protein [Rhodospirillales bacterium]
MTDTKARRLAANRARAATKALRWAMRGEVQRPSRRLPLAQVMAVGCGIILGAALGLAYDSAGPVGLATAPERETAALSHPSELGAALPQPLPAEASEKSQTTSLETERRDPHPALFQERAPGPREAPREQIVLVPAAAPAATLSVSEPEHVPALGSILSAPEVAYEEPLDSAVAGPGPSEQEIEAALQEVALGPIEVPALPRDGLPLWQRNSVAVSDSAGRPMIAIVIDDLGLNRVNARRSIALPPPLTLAFMTYAEGLEAMTGAARVVGHELLVHVPMEPEDPSYDAGENVLTTGLDNDDLERRLDWALGRFEGYVGINNHMGSKFTRSPLGMAQVMAELRSRGLLFLDSRTSGRSVGMGLAARMGVAHTGRDVFIDNNPDDPNSIRRQLEILEETARRHGKAVGIGHPHDATLEVLAQWLPEVEKRGFVLVPISAIVQREILTAAAREGAG